MVRSGFRLWAGIIFWAVMIIAFIANGGIWPLKGFWPLALCAFAIGGLAMLIIGIIYWAPLRNLALVPDIDATEFLAKLKPGVMIALFLSLILAVRALAELSK